MNYVLITTDKEQTETIFLGQIDDNFYVKITEIKNSKKGIPFFEFTKTNCVHHEFDPIYQVIKDPEEVAKIENRMVSSFLKLFPNWN